MQELTAQVDAASTKSELEEAYAALSDAMFRGTITAEEMAQLTAVVKGKYANVASESVVDKAKGKVAGIIESVKNVGISPDDAAAALRGRMMGNNVSIVTANFARNLALGIIKTPGTLMMSDEKLRTLISEGKFKVK